MSSRIAGPFTAKSMPPNVWMLGLVSMLNDISSEMILPVLPLFLVSILGANVTAVGAIEGIAESIASLLKVFSGAFSDYLGRRKVLVVAGYSLSTLVKPLFAVAPTSVWVLVARCGDRVGKGVRGAARDALIADSVSTETRGAAFGLRQSLDTVGAVIGPVAASALMVFWHSSFRFIFACAVIPAVAAVLILLIGVKEPKGGGKLSKGNPLEWQALKRLGRPYWILVAVALVFNCGNSSDAFLILRANKLGLAAEFVPLTIVVMNIIYALSAAPLGALSDRIGRFSLLAGSFAFYALVYLGFAWTSAAWQVWVLFALYGLYLGMSQGVLSAMVADLVEDDQRGTAFGFINLATGITLLPASLLAGALWEKASPSASFMAGSVFALAALLLLVFCLRPTLKNTKV